MEIILHDETKSKLPDRFGVNMLDIGLHSYGFTDAAFKWLLAFVASQLFFIALGLLPGKWWKSFRGTQA